MLQFTLGSAFMAKRRRSSEEWHQLIQQQEGSGQSVSAFCVSQGLCSTAFYAWRRRFRKDGVDRTSFVRLEASGHGASVGTRMTLTTPDGYRLEFNGWIAPQRIAEVVSLLDRRARGC